jgi:hypothetical protein
VKIFLPPFSFEVTLFTLVKIFLSPFSFEVTLFTVGGDLPVTVQY